LNVARQQTLNEEWRRLQAAFLSTVGDAGPFEISSGTVVVVPSLTLPEDELKDVVGIQFYEERLLFLLLTLSRPDIRLVFVSTADIAPEIIDYYLDLIPYHESVRKRLTLVSVGDIGRQPLTAKILEHQEVVTFVRNIVQMHGNAFLLPFNVTRQEEELAARLGIPIYGMPSRAAHFGGKSGSRYVARAACVPAVDGVENIRTHEDVRVAFTRLCRNDAERVVLKLNDSFSGMGNVILSRRSDGGAVAIAGGLWALLPQGVTTWDDFLQRLFLRCGTMERMLEGPLAAPSVQILIKPGRGPEVVSTHDQILGGQANQIYLGCEFPANERYRDKIVKYARQIADILKEHEVVGLFSVDFLVSLQQNQVYFGEINLRLGGTTHPFGISRYVTNAVYDEVSGLLVSPLGPRYYVASDNVQDDLLIGKSPADILKAMCATGLLFDHSRLAGVTMHQLGSVPESGKLGICSIAASPKEARNAFYSAFNALVRS
jgi:PGM1 C-terminal domain/ATP-grasp domain